MNLKRFTARTSREALALVRQAFGDDAVVMSTRPCPEGVEVLAMAPESVQQLERVGSTAEPPRPQPNIVQPREAPPAPAKPAVRSGERLEPVFDDGVAQDVEQLQMSTLSFQDYVRQRMLKRREAQLASDAVAEPAPPVVAPIAAARSRQAASRQVPVLHEELSPSEPVLANPPPPAAPASVAPGMTGARVDVAAVAVAAPDRSQAEQIEMMGELRSMRGLIEQRFGALAFMEKLQRQPRQAQLAQRLLGSVSRPHWCASCWRGCRPTSMSSTGLPACWNEISSPASVTRHWRTPVACTR